MRSVRQVLILLAITQSGIAGVQAQDAAAPDSAILARLQNIEDLLSNQGLLEMLQQLEALQVEIGRLRGEVEVQHHVLEQIKKRQRDLYTDIDRRLQRIENPPASALDTAAPEAAPPLQTLSPFADREDTGAQQQTDTPLTLELVGRESPAGTTGEGMVSLAEPEQPPEPIDDQGMAEAVAGPAQGISSPEGPEEVQNAAPSEMDAERAQAEYRYAFNLLKQSLYDRSVTAFREFLARNPDSEYADNAQFWLGEAYFVNSLFDQALLEYNALLQNYPGSPKLAQAKLKAGFCQHELGLIEPAKQQLEELIQQYPGTTAARLAQDRLKQIAAAPVPADMTPAD